MFLSISPPSSAKVWVVGDIHGCLGELNSLLSFLEQSGELLPTDVIVFLGDYIDRGKDSRGVIERLLELSSRIPQTYFIKGNHEEMFASFIDGASSSNRYLECGGLECIQSYGGTGNEDINNRKSLIPASHLHFLKELHIGVLVDNFLLVHAGIDPSCSLEQQTEDKILWIRDEFLNRETIINQTVVFGHTPMEEIFLDLPWKIGIDTGLVFGYKLTALELRSMSVLQIKKGESLPKRSQIAEINKGQAK
jgi:serine/threonine protein phosphatase 1